MNNPPISPDMPIKDFLSAHGYRMVPTGAQQNPAPRKKRAFDWKKRWKSKAAMHRYMNKIRAKIKRK